MEAFTNFSNLVSSPPDAILTTLASLHASNTFGPKDMHNKSRSLSLASLYKSPKAPKIVGF